MRYTARPTCRPVLAFFKASIAALPLFAHVAAAVDRAVVLSTDFETGYYSRLDLASPYGHQNAIQSACADAVVRVHGDRIYVIGRFGCDHIQVIDPSNFATIRQFSTGNGTNPQDIEIYSPTKAYVSLYERSSLLIVNPQSGGTAGAVDLSVFADADGLPEAAEMALAGNRLFVCVQRLDRFDNFNPNNPSFIAVVDCATDQLVDVNPSQPGVQGIPLTGRNPFSELVVDRVRDKLYVAEAGFFGQQDGGVEFIDPVALRAEGFFITEAQLGGDVNAARLWVDSTGYAIVNDSSFRTKLVRFDRVRHTVDPPCWQSSGFDLCDIEIDRHGLLLLSDRDFVQPGVRLFRAADCSQITTQPIDFGLPPCDMAPVEAPSPTDTESPPTPTAVRLLPNWPDPFNPSTTLRVEAPAGTRVVLDIVDVRGRRVRSLWTGPLPRGARDFVWDGRDDRSTPLPSGVYRARLRSPAGTRTETLTLVH